MGSKNKKNPGNIVITVRNLVITVRNLCGGDLFAVYIITLVQNQSERAHFEMRRPGDGLTLCAREQSCIAARSCFLQQAGKTKEPFGVFLHRNMCIKPRTVAPQKLHSVLCIQSAHNVQFSECAVLSDA